MCAFTRRQHSSAWNDLMATILKLWYQIKNPTVNRWAFSWRTFLLMFAWIFSHGRDLHSLHVLIVVALMESVRSLDASSLPLNRDQFLDLASSLNEFFLQNGLIKAEPSSSTNFQQMASQSQMPIHPANFPQELSPHMYQNYPGSDDQTPSPGKSLAWFSS